MSEYNHPECDESFLQQPSKVDDLMQLLNVLATVDKSEELVLNKNLSPYNMHISFRSLKAKKKAPESVVDYSANLTDKNYLVAARNSNSNSRMTKRSRSRLKLNCNQVVFMRQIDQTVEQRKESRKERVLVANRFRRWVRIPNNKEHFIKKKRVDWFRNSNNDKP